MRNLRSVKEVYETKLFDEVNHLITNGWFLINAYVRGGMVIFVLAAD